MIAAGVQAAKAAGASSAAQTGLQLGGEAALDVLRPPSGQQQADDGSNGRSAGFWAAVALGSLVMLLLLVIFVTLERLYQAVTFGGDDTCAAADCSGAGLPPLAQPFVKFYTDAGETYGVNRYVLMAIHERESDYSDSPSPGVRDGRNYAGCCAGPMQFMISSDGATPTVGGRGGTWAQYRDAVTGYRGRKPKGKRPTAPGAYVGQVSGPHPNVYDSYDAIYAAAAYLMDEGVGKEIDEQTRIALAQYGGGKAFIYAGKVIMRAKQFERVGATQVSSVPEPSGEPPTLARLIDAANTIDTGNWPYCWNGGHAARPGPSPIEHGCWRKGQLGAKRVFDDTGLDCSGAVRWLLVLAGYPDLGPLHSSQFGVRYPSGPGKHVTIWSSKDHVYVTIKGRDWGTTTSNPDAHGAWWGPQSILPDAVASHPEGL